MKDNVKSIHIELNGDKPDTYSMEIIKDDGTILFPYVKLSNLLMLPFGTMINTIIIDEEEIK